VKILEKKMDLKTEIIVNILEISNVIQIEVKDVNHLKIMIILEILRKKNMKNALNIKVTKKVMIIGIEIKEVYIAIIMNVIIVKTKKAKAKVKVKAKKISQIGKMGKEIIVVMSITENA
jgi:hypothetical protein